ncbi:MAG: hypothetical protein RBS07_13480 [Lentimicrobium sp.]|jgi:hypothetical protein|nr:hypothetical protein [Lentimicrobium sp.]
MRKFTMVLALLIFAGAQLVLAQTTITGKVTNAEDGTGIPGATVLVKGTNYGLGFFNNFYLCFNITDYPSF